MSNCMTCKYARNDCFSEACADCEYDRNTKTYSKYEPKKESQSVEHICIHAQVCDELKTLYRNKNADYGDSFHKTFVEEGMAMARIRLTDKLERFKRLTKSGEQNVKDESIRDTLIDLANYAIMTIVEMERKDGEK